MEAKYLPKAGEMVQYLTSGQSGWMQGKCGGVSESQVWIPGKILLRIMDTEFRPVSKKTADEEAVFGLMFYGDQSQTVEKAMLTLDAIKSGKIKNVKWIQISDQND